METTKEGPFMIKCLKKDLCLGAELTADGWKLQLQEVTNDNRQLWYAHKTPEYFKLQHVHSEMFLSTPLHYIWAKTLDHNMLVQNKTDLTLETASESDDQKWLWVDGMHLTHYRDQRVLNVVDALRYEGKKGSSLKFEPGVPCDVNPKNMGMEGQKWLILKA